MGNPNLFLMLGGHYDNEGMRQDPGSDGHAIYSLRSDYQTRANGGDGWLRLLRFSPEENKIYISTYSPYLDQYETDADSQFSLDYNMNTYALTVNKSGTGSGTVTSVPTGIVCGTTCMTNYAYNTEVTLTAAAGTGSTFSGWSGSGCSGTGTCMLTMDAARSVTAAFTLNTYELTVNKAGTGSGTVTSAPTGIDCGTTCTASFDYNTEVTLTADESAGSTFSGWSGSGCSGTGTCMVTMDTARSVTVNFTSVISQSIPLVTGWNLVSFRLHPLSTVILDVLASVDGSYDLVYAWDATGGHASAGNWMRYAPGIPGNTLSSLDEHQGFWIRMTAPGTLTITGTVPVTTNISLSTNASGWNLVGYPSNATRSMPEALTSHGVTDYSLVYGYHAEDADTWKRYAPGVPGNDLLELAPGWGYWIKVGAAGTWHVEY
jgi:hypothetical protein